MTPAITETLPVMKAITLDEEVERMGKVELLYAPSGNGKNHLSTRVLLDSHPSAYRGRQAVRISYTLGSVYQGVCEYHWDAHGNIRREYTYLIAPGAGTTSVAGYPEIPQEGIFIAVPDKLDEKSIKVVASQVDKPLEKPLAKLLRPAFSIIEGAAKSGIGPFNPISGYTLNKYPANKAFCRFIGLRTIQGITVAHVLVYPVHYFPSNNSLQLFPKMIIELSYDVPQGGDVLPKRPSMLGDMIFFRKKDGPWQPPLNGGPSTGHIVHLKRTDNVGEYLIIAPSTKKPGQISLADAVQPLLDSKAGSFHRRLVTTEQIALEFTAPNPNQNPNVRLKLSIRAFLHWALENWKVPPRYVVLAGDVDKIALHPRHLKGDDEVAVYPSDHFYADLNSTVGPDLVISRIPTSDPNRMKQICRQLAKYPECCNAPKKEWRRRVLMVADKILTDGDLFNDFEDCLESIISFIKMRDDLDLEFTSKYATKTSSVNDVIGEMNKGALVVNYRGHGSSISWTSTNGLSKDDLEKLNTIEMPPLVFCICCSNAKIDDAQDAYTGLDSFVETYLGASGPVEVPRCVAIIGATRESPHLANNDFNRYLWQAILQGEKTPGGIFQRAKALMVQNHPKSDDHTKNVWMYMLLGDPAAEVIP